MKIYIDFDGTIFNNSKLDQNFKSLFKEYNIPINYIEQLIDEIKNYNLVTEQLIKEYNLNSNILTKINSIYSDDFIYKDSLHFLKKYHNKYTLILLTYTTDKKYQLNKINSSNINKYFKEIIITTKNKAKLDNIDYNNGIFIDNNPIELERFYNSNATKLIRIKRNNDKYSKLNLNIKNIPEFNNFEELDNSNYLEKIGEI